MPTRPQGFLQDDQNSPTKCTSTITEKTIPGSTNKQTKPTRMEIKCPRQQYTGLLTNPNSEASTFTCEVCSLNLTNHPAPLSGDLSLTLHLDQNRSGYTGFDDPSI